MVLAIDPSINHVGWAVFKNSGQYYKSGILHTNGRDSDKLTQISNIVHEKLLIMDILVVEIPGKITYARSTGKGGKALNTASMMKLNWSIGAVLLTAGDHDQEVHQVIGHQWKGRAGKEVFKALALQITGKQKISDHEADSVMLGRYYFDVIKRR